MINQRLSLGKDEKEREDMFRIGGCIQTNKCCISYRDFSTSVIGKLLVYMTIIVTIYY